MKRLAAQLLLAWIVLAALVCLPLSSYALDVASYAGVLAILALGVAITFGQLGYVSFGHAAFFGLGAYSAGLLTTGLGWNYWTVAVPLSIIPGALLGVLVGFASARLSGAYFAIATLVVSEILALLAINWVDLTHGPMGLMVVLPPTPGAEAVHWSAQQAYLFVVFAVLLLCFFLLRNLKGSPTGRSWAAIREAPALAESLGIATGAARVLNVTLSGGVAALAGALFVPKIFVLSPALFGVSYSASGLLAVILGGKATLLGPILGGALFAVLPEALRFMGDLNFAAFALLLLLAVRLLPGGIVGWLASSPRLARWRHGLRSTRARARARGVPPLPEPVPLEIRAQAGAPGKDVDAHAPALSVSHVSRQFKGLKAVVDVSFDVRRGEIVGLIGPNGAGKTTLLTMLSGFLPPSQGSVSAFGQSLAGLSPNRVARLGLVRTFQQTAVCAGLTVEANMRIAAHLYRPRALFASLLGTTAYQRREQERLAHALGCLAEVGMSHRLHDIAGSLPYGEQKLLGAAMALAARPAVLLLDEPAAGLNAVEALRLAEVLRALREKGMTLVVVDHNLQMLMSIADRVVVLHHGVKIADGLPQAVVAQADVIAAYLGSAGARSDEAQTANPAALDASLGDALPLRSELEPRGLQ